LKEQNKGLKIDNFTREELVESGLGEEDVMAVLENQDRALKFSRSTGITYEEARDTLNNWSYELPESPEGQWKHAVAGSQMETIRRGEAFDANVDLDTLR